MLAGLEKRKRFQGYSTPHTVLYVVPLQSVVWPTHAESGPPIYRSIHLLAAKDIAVRSVGLWVYSCGGSRLACMGARMDGREDEPTLEGRRDSFACVSIAFEVLDSEDNYAFRSAGDDRHAR